MATHESNVDLVKKADRVANLSFWLFLAMGSTALGALAFNFSFEIVQGIFIVITLVSWGVKVLEVKILRRALIPH